MEEKNKIKKGSVAKLIKLRNICIVLVIVLALMLLITFIVQASNAQSSSDKTAFILGAIFSLIIFAFIAYIVYLIFGVNIDKRSENIDYMNERIDCAEKLNQKIDNKKK